MTLRFRPVGLPAAALSFVVSSVLILAVPLVGRAGQSSSSAQKQWYDLYDEAIEHVRRREWGPAETKLLAAKTNGRQPGRRVLRYGSLRQPFFPDYYLGIVYQNTSRPKQALDAFQLARRQNIDATDREFQQIDAFTRTAEAEIARAETAAPKPYVPADPAPRPADPTTSTSMPTQIPPVDTGAANRKRFDDLIAEARTELARRNYAKALVSASQARDLGVDQARADAIIQEAERANLADQISADIQAGDLPAATAKLDRLRQLDPGGAEVSRLTEAIRNAGSAANAAARQAAAERNAMRQFYAGDYQRALRVLGDLEKAQPLSPRAYFYRACSLAALALRSGSADASQLSEARRVYAQSLRAANEFERDRRFISPKILQALAGR
jgi:hypothetical protein